jgi:signal transduction histidine kinase
MKTAEKKYLHDIMSPLAGMEMMVESLLEDIPAEGDEKGVRERLDAIAQGILKMRAITVARRTEAELEDE